MTGLSHEVRQGLRFARSAADDEPARSRLASVVGRCDKGSGMAPALALGILEALQGIPAAWWPVEAV